MKPRRFKYTKPSDLAEALRLLQSNGDGAQILAGGQSLVPSLNFRLSAPDLLVDINGLKQLSGITKHADFTRIGALCRYREIETNELIAQHAPLLRQAVPYVAHPAIRNRGTIGGSVALADPAAEMPACLVALGATMILAHAEGQRTVAAKDFFKGLYETELGGGEILVAIDVPNLVSGCRSAFQEITRRHGDYAMCGAAAHARVDGTRISQANIVYFSVGATPVTAKNAMAALEGRSVDEAVVASVQDALVEDLEPFDDVNCSGKLRMHYARQIAGRILDQLTET